MKNIFAIYIFLVISMMVKSQDLQTFSQSKRFFGKGEIAGQKVTMTLDYIGRFNYSNTGCINKYYTQIIGTYSYTKHGGGIPIVGEHITWTLEKGSIDSLVLYELNDKYEKIGLFKGKLSAKDFNGQWITIETQKKYNFNINWNTNNLGYLKYNWNEREYVLPTGGVDSFQGSFIFEEKIERDNSLILILRITEPCCGTYNCRGTNCGGDNEYLYLFLLTNNGVKYYRELISSGAEGTEVVHSSKASDSYTLAIEDMTGQYLIKIDYNDCEKGITKKKLK